MREVVAVLCNVRSLHNVGSIFRTADGAGVSKLYLCGVTPEPVDRFGNWRPRLAKVSLGAERTVPWERAPSALRLLRRFKKEGCKILAVEQAKNSVVYYKSRAARRGGKLALVVGSEVGGLPRSVLALADEILEIPMRGATVRHARHPRRAGGGKESLNVSVAFGIAAFSILERGGRGLADRVKTRNV